MMSWLSKPRNVVSPPNLYPTISTSLNMVVLLMVELGSVRVGLLPKSWASLASKNLPSSPVMSNVSAPNLLYPFIRQSRHIPHKITVSSKYVNWLHKLLRLFRIIICQGNFADCHFFGLWFDRHDIPPIALHPLPCFTHSNQWIHR